jgi:hypothetical protein
MEKEFPMGFTSPPPPPDRIAQSLWQLSVTLKTGKAPELDTFESLPEEEKRYWVSLAVMSINMTRPTPKITPVT